MTDTDYNKLLPFQNMQGSGLIPFNAESLEFNEQLKKDEVVYFKNMTPRDLKLHGAYFLLLAEVWGYLPKKFRDNVPKPHFYNWMKMYQGKYKVVFKFKDGKELIEYESISFGRMNNNAFKDYIKTQIPIFYEILLASLPDNFANAAIDTIENNFEKMFSKL